MTDSPAGLYALGRQAAALLQATAMTAAPGRVPLDNECILHAGRGGTCTRPVIISGSAANGPYVADHGTKSPRPMVSPKTGHRPLDHPSAGLHPSVVCGSSSFR